MMHLSHEKFRILIPARANSERLPGKNMMLLGGIPLIQHTINYARQNGFLDIAITSNDEKVLAYAKKNDLNAIVRPKTLSGPNEPVITAIQHAVREMSGNFEYVILLQPTNPFRPEGLVEEAIGLIEEKDYDSLMTVTRSDKKLGKINDAGFKPYNYKMGQRSQDLEPLYYENGLLYITRKEELLTGRILAENNFPLVVDHPFADLDIDTLNDFHKAEFYYNFYFDKNVK